MVDVERVVADLLKLYEEKAVLWHKMSLLDQEIKVLRDSVSPETLKKRGI